MESSAADLQPARRSAAVEPLEETFAQHRDQLYGMLYFLVANEAEAQEALGETLTKCWRHRRSAQEHLDMRLWLFRVALNVGRALRGAVSPRRKPPRQMGTTPVLRDRLRRLINGVNAAEEARDERLARIREALWQLRLQEQEVFLLRQNGQLSYEQISQVVGSPVEMVKTRMRLALRKLHEALT